MMDSPEMVTTHSKQVLKRTMDGEKTLSLTCRFESSHLPLLLPRWLMRSLDSVILVLRGSVSHGGEDLTMGSVIALKLVCNQLPRWFPLEGKIRFGKNLIGHTARGSEGTT